MPKKYLLLFFMLNDYQSYKVFENLIALGFT